MIPAAFAAIRQLSYLRGSEYWKKAFAGYEAHNFNISEAILQGIEIVSPVLQENLFTPKAASFSVVVSAVITPEAAEQTQGEGARRLGQKLIISTRKKDRSWANNHLRAALFDTKSRNPDYRLTQNNLKAIFYATTRMLHAWKMPAWINGRPYIDASYTCSCPAIELAQRGYERILAIVPEPGTIYRDIFQAEPIPDSYNGVPIYKIQPEWSLGEMGVDYLSATEEGFEKAYKLGREKGKELIDKLEKNTI
ncbi:MAG: hypothetical protein AB1798_14590 [Spirochaetota bacterium]